MSKVCVIESCWDCPWVEEVITGVTFIGYRCTYADRMVPMSYIPDHCPLPDMPERCAESDTNLLLDAVGAYAAGWNDCLDAIDNDLDVTADEGKDNIGE